LRLRNDQRNEFLTGRMLMSAAYVSLGKYDQGVKIAREAYDSSGDAHSTVRAELGLNLAIAHYRKGEYARASSLLEDIPEEEDIIYVRALQFRGGVAWALGDFGGSLKRFHEALDRLDRCRHHDRFIEAQLLFSFAYLCGELPRLDLWPELLKRIEQFDWSVSGVSVWLFWIAIEASFITEMLGDLDASATWAIDAEEAACDPASLIIAWCRLAARYGRYGEKGAHSYFVTKAGRKYDACRRDARLKEHKTLSLDIAEEMLCSNAPMSASRLVTYFAEVVAPTVFKNGDEGRQIEADYAMILGQLEEKRGNRGRAQEAYLRALEIYRQKSLMRRAAIVAYRLFALTGETRYQDFIADVLRDASPAYWVKARLAQSQTEARLTARQLEVVRLVAQGLTDKEIGAACGISYARARNVVADARKMLGVRSRSELASVATSREIGRAHV
jgi:DNA-binding CsgD family transcriptional regulator